MKRLVFASLFFIFFRKFPSPLTLENFLAMRNVKKNLLTIIELSVKINKFLKEKPC